MASYGIKVLQSKADAGIALTWQEILKRPEVCVVLGILWPRG